MISSAPRKTFSEIGASTSAGTRSSASPRAIPLTPPWWSMIPLFFVGFAMISLVRTVGDAGDQAFGFLPAGQWNTIVGIVKNVAEWCLAIAMAAVGLGTSIKGLVRIGLKPLGVGMFSAVLVGVVSFSLISILF